MQGVTCPVCGAFVGFIPDGWEAHITHHGVSHSLTVERPVERPNPD